jgi:hypothetical protein
MFIFFFWREWEKLNQSQQWTDAFQWSPNHLYIGQQQQMQICKIPMLKVFTGAEETTSFFSTGCFFVEFFRRRS